MTHHKWLKKRRRDNQTMKESNMRRNAHRKGRVGRGGEISLASFLSKMRIQKSANSLKR